MFQKLYQEKTEISRNIHFWTDKIVILNQLNISNLNFSFGHFPEISGKNG